MKITEIPELLKIIETLNDQYNEKHKRNFTLDGKLIGNIGEVWAAETYGLELLDENVKVHDARVINSQQEKLVQIKASMNKNFYFPNGDVIPQYFLCVSISREGELDEVFNGTGEFIVEHYIKARNLKAKKAPYKLSEKRLRELNKIKGKDKIYGVNGLSTKTLGH